MKLCDREERWWRWLHVFIVWLLNSLELIPPDAKCEITPISQHLMSTEEIFKCCEICIISCMQVFPSKIEFENYQNKIAA